MSVGAPTVPASHAHRRSVQPPPSAGQVGYSWTLQRLPHTGNTPLYQHHTRLFIALTTQDTRLGIHKSVQDGKDCGPARVPRIACRCHDFGTWQDAQAFYDGVIIWTDSFGATMDNDTVAWLDGADGMYNQVVCEMFPGAPSRPVKGSWASVIKYGGMRNVYGQGVFGECDKPARMERDGIYYELLQYKTYTDDDQDYPCLVEGGVIDYVVDSFTLHITAAPRSAFGPLQIWINGVEVNIISRTSRWLGNRPIFGVDFDIGLDLDVRYPDSAVMCAGENTLEIAFHAYDMDNMRLLWIEYWREQGKRPRSDITPFGFINDMLTENPELLKLHRAYLPIVVGDNLGLNECGD